MANEEETKRTIRKPVPIDPDIELEEHIYKLEGGLSMDSTKRKQQKGM